MQGAQQAGADATSSIVNNAYNQGLAATGQALNSQLGAASAGVGQGYGAGASAGGLGAQLAGLGTQGMSSGANTGANLYNFGNNTGLGALGHLPGLAQMAYAPGMAQGAVGNQLFQLQGAKLGEASNRYTTAQMLPFLQAQDVAGLAMGMGGGSAVTQASQPQNWGSTLMGLGSLGMLGYGLGLL